MVVRRLDADRVLTVNLAWSASMTKRQVSRASPSSPLPPMGARSHSSCANTRLSGCQSPRCGSMTSAVRARASSSPAGPGGAGVSTSLARWTDSS